MKEISYKNQFGDFLFGNSWEIENPEKLIIIITGMAEHSERYDDFAKFLNSNKMSVYCLDHYGQGEGKNGELGNPVDGFFFKMQDTVLEFSKKLREEHPGLPVYIFSHSMGSFVTQGYLEKYGDSIDKFVICGSNGPNGAVKMGKTLSHMIVTKKNRDKKATLLNDLAIGSYSKPHKKDYSLNAWLSYNKDNVLKYDADPYSGYVCTNGFYRSFMDGMASIQNKKNLAKVNKNIPIFIIAGQDDPVGNFGKGVKKLFELYKRFDLNVECKIYEHMRHEILNEDEHQKVYEDILAFYNK